jgi:prepilin-type N-terminal cleavage/methylation domain-containing protein
MVKLSNQAGFSLIEVVIVLAIASGMLTMVLAGQQQLRTSANFTAAVDKLIAGIGDTRNQALSGVNIGHANVGTGADHPCGGAGVTQFAGTTWNASPGGNTVYTRQVWAITNSNGSIATCADSTQDATISTVVPLTMTSPGQVQVLYMRNNNGGLQICLIPSSANAAPDFTSGTCRNNETNPVTMTVTDGLGNTSRIKIDPASGLAQRI